MENLEEFISGSGLSEAQWLMIAIMSMIALGVVIFWLRKAFSDDARIHRVIRCLGPKYLSNMRFPDGIDGEITIDHLVLTQPGLLLVSIKQYDGMIYGAETLEQWRQITPNGSYEFPNPLKELRFKGSVIEKLLPDIHLDYLVLFAGDSAFPKSMPANVKHLDEIERIKSPLKMNKELQLFWNRVCDVTSYKAT